MWNCYEVYHDSGAAEVFVWCGADCILYIYFPTRLIGSVFKELPFSTSVLILWLGEILWCLSSMLYLVLSLCCLPGQPVRDSSRSALRKLIEINKNTCHKILTWIFCLSLQQSTGTSFLLQAQNNPSMVHFCPEMPSGTLHAPLLETYIHLFSTTQMSSKRKTFCKVWEAEIFLSSIRASKPTCTVWNNTSEDSSRFITNLCNHSLVSSLFKQRHTKLDHLERFNYKACV